MQINAFTGRTVKNNALGFSLSSAGLETKQLRQNEMCVRTTGAVWCGTIEYSSIICRYYMQIVFKCQSLA
jgi:hypothetical protein